MYELQLMSAGLIRVAEANGVSPLHYSSIPHISSHAAPEPKRFCLEPTVPLSEWCAAFEMCSAMYVHVHVAALVAQW